MNLSIRKRLLLSNVSTLLFVAVCGLIAFQAVRDLDAAMQAVRDNGSAIKDQLQADMAHDAIRGDVLGILLSATNGDAAQATEARKDLLEHTTLLRARLASMAGLTSDAALQQAMASVIPDAEAYLSSASAIGKMGTGDKAAIDAAYPAFLASFRTLEESMAALSEHIEQNSTLLAAAGENAARNAKRQILGVSILSMVVACIGPNERACHRRPAQCGHANCRPHCPRGPL